MTKIVKIKGHASLAPAGKQRVAVSMYAKGKAFIAAAILLQEQSHLEHVDYVVLHLLCQGIEIALKGLLLLQNYDYFISRLRRPLGHNLLQVAEEASTVYGLHSLRTDLKHELRTLNNLYSRHSLRYGSGYDILIDPRTISRERIFHRLVAMIRLAERELKRI